MPRTAAKVTQADIARTVRAVAQARVKAVVEVAPDGTIRVVIGDFRPDEVRSKNHLEEIEEIVP